MEVLYNVVDHSKGDGAVVGQILRSSRVVVGESEPAGLYMRFLFAFEDGFQAAAYVQCDFTGKEKPCRDLLVDPNENDWLMLLETSRTKGEGFQAMKRADDEDQLQALVGFETPRLRVNQENKELFSGGSVPAVFRNAEPSLVEFVQQLRSHLGEIGNRDWGVLRVLPDAIAEYLVLEVVPPAGYQLRVDRRSFLQDEPKPAEPLAPELEAVFGKWAVWGDLPRLGDH